MTGLSRRADARVPSRYPPSRRSRDECSDDRDPLRDGRPTLPRRCQVPVSSISISDFGNFPEMLLAATKSVGMSMIFRGQGSS